ncbi:BrnT family toxin [Candidatus Marithrix sp. Canyon 246]|uniref:BrnT family toxin n=1 Tax=Candidatus Marithrix sp. Canyon 246 TaxID=1827136 RepID=UPI0009F674E5
MLPSKQRYFALGKTNTRRKLFICFTIRNNLIRVISARDMTRNEKRRYSLL